MSATSNLSWESRALEKKSNILSLLPKEYIHSGLSHSTTETASVQGIPQNFLSPKELEITALDVPAILSALASGEYTSVQVLQAFTHRAAIAHQLLNCCMEFSYASALSRAQKLDDSFRASGGKTVGPLHGLPFSVKDQCRVIGTETTCGPSAYQGLWGLRPSSGRIPYHDVLNSMEGQEIMPSVVGPMSHSVSSLTLFTKTVIAAQPWLVDPKCQPILWREEIYQSAIAGKKLKIGIMEWDEEILPQPPIRWAMRELEARLKAAGHEVFPWRIDQKTALSIVMRVFSSDASGDIDRSRALSGEPPQNVMTAISPNVPPLTLLGYWSLACERLAFQAAILEQWNETSKAGSSDQVMDVYLTPVNPAVAPKHGHYGRGRYLAYTGTVNVLDFSACTVPVGFVDPEIHKADQGSTLDANGKEIPAVRSELDGYLRSIYDPEVYKGLPVTVQVVGRRMEEEKVLGVATMLEKLLKERP
ncbi:Acetamidase [Hyphodiscus hymeniophilus]|uniref:Acetamidase n=1 Tax=Hyphodiscus hymeniophilus TaxID=353542 RepID=A0A9P6VK81_9HELO|nr:Acetamidase [Hyphodiscus hymeniophilus]